MASAKISDRHPAARERLAKPQRVGARGVVRVQGRDELVDGHRPPGGHPQDRAGGSASTASAERTATTRKSRPSGPLSTVTS